MNKEQWIERYAITLMASYDAKEYDYNCYNGWGQDSETPLRYMDYEEALALAESAYKRMMEFKEDHK